MAKPGGATGGQTKGGQQVAKARDATGGQSKGGKQVARARSTGKAESMNQPKEKDHK